MGSSEGLLRLVGRESRPRQRIGILLNRHRRIIGRPLGRRATCREPFARYPGAVRPRGRCPRTGGQLWLRRVRQLVALFYCPAEPARWVAQILLVGESVSVAGAVFGTELGNEVSGYVSA